MKTTDILIVGSGCSGLYAALNLPDDKQITVISKSDLESNDSFLAQGGICMLKNDDDYDSYFEDTMKAGHYENDKKSVDIMIRSSQDVIHDLVDYGVEFARDENGHFLFTRARKSPAIYWLPQRPSPTSPFTNTRRCSISSKRTIPATAALSRNRTAVLISSELKRSFWPLAGLAVCFSTRQITAT